MKRYILVLFIAVPTFLEGQDTPHLACDFERMVDRNVTDRSGEYRDTFEGNFELAPRISGQGIIMDTDGTEMIIIWLRQKLRTFFILIFIFSQIVTGDAQEIR